MLCAFLAPSAAAATCAREPAAAAIAPLKLIAYFPTDNAWTYMWTRWRPSAVDADFRRIADLGANTVRLVVSPRVTGYPSPSRRFLERLESAVALAAVRGLRVQLTLFDWWRGYDDPDGSKHWASAVLAPFAGDPRLAFVELKNEIDLSDPGAAPWVRELLPHVREAACGPPVTISVRGTEPAATVRALKEALEPEQPDFYDVHYFGRAELAYHRFSEALREAAPLPLLVGEVGYSTWAGNRLVSGLPRSPAAREAEQAHYLRTVQHAAHALGLPAAAPWVYADFHPAGIPPSGPRDLAQEHHFGLHRKDGSPKPAARSPFDGSTSFNGGFEAGVPSRGADLPALWRIRGAAHGVVRRDTSVLRTGSASLRLGSRDSRPTGRLAVHVAPVGSFVVAGRVYAASAWGRGAGTTTLALEWYDRDARRIGSVASAPLAATLGWAQLTVSATAPPGAAFAEVVLETRGNPAAVWLDDVEFSTAS